MKVCLMDRVKGLSQDDRLSDGNYLLDVPVVGCPGDPQGLADFRHGVALVAGKGLQLLDLLGTQHPGSTKQPATGTSRRQPCVGSLPDEIPLEFSQCPEDVEDQLAA